MNPSRNIKYFPNIYSFDKMKLVLTNFYFTFTFWYYPVSFPINLVHFVALKRLMLQVNFVAFTTNKQTKTTQKPKPTSQTKNPNNSKAKQKLTNKQTTKKKNFLNRHWYFFKVLGCTGNMISLVSDCKKADKCN